MVPTSKFAKRVASYLEEAKADPLFILRENEVQAAIVGIDEFEHLKMLEALFGDLLLLIADARLGRVLRGETQTIPFDDILAREGVSRADLED